MALDHPTTSCFLCVVIAGSGTIISSLMLGQPPLNTVLNERGVCAGVFIWYLVHHCPHDFFYILSSYKYMKVTLDFLLHFRIVVQCYFQLFLNMMEEFRRARNVMIGVLMASDVYPGSVLPLALAGMFKGNLLFSSVLAVMDSHVSITCLI